MAMAMASGTSAADFTFRDPSLLHLDTWNIRLRFLSICILRVIVFHRLRFIHRLEQELQLNLTTDCTTLRIFSVAGDLQRHSRRLPNYEEHGLTLLFGSIPSRPNTIALKLKPYPRYQDEPAVVFPNLFADLIFQPAILLQIFISTERPVTMSCSAHCLLCCQ